MKIINITANVVIAVSFLVSICLFPANVLASGYRFTLTDPDSGGSIILKIPDEYRYGVGSRDEEGTTINLLTFYPNMRGLADPQNAAYGADCIGYCNGRELLSIENHSTRVLSGGSAVDRIKDRFFADKDDATMDPAHLAVVEHYIGEGLVSFDVNIEQTDQSGERRVAQSTRYILREASKDGIGYAAECSMHTPVQGCTISFSPKCCKGILVKIIGILFERLANFQHIISLAAKFAESLIDTPVCSRGASQE